MNINNWMSWEGGVDLVAFNDAGLETPNVIIHVARMVHTPVGSAPSGMVLWQPEPSAPPLVAGFVSTDQKVAAYFGAHIFVGTPFEHAPALVAEISINIENGVAKSSVKVAGLHFETTLRELGEAKLIHREPSPMAPFWQQGLEQAAGAATLSVNGGDVPLTIPPAGISGGPAAVLASCGVYAR